MTQSDLFLIVHKKLWRFQDFPRLRWTYWTRWRNYWSNAFVQESRAKAWVNPVSRLINLNQVRTQCLVRLHTYCPYTYVRRSKRSWETCGEKVGKSQLCNQLWLSEGRVLRVHGRTKCQFVLRERRIESTDAHSPRAKGLTLTEWYMYVIKALTTERVNWV